MDANRFKETFTRLEVLDDRLSYRVRSGAKNRGTSPEQLDMRVKDVAELVSKLKNEAGVTARSRHPN